MQSFTDASRPFSEASPNTVSAAAGSPPMRPARMRVRRVLGWLYVAPELAGVKAHRLFFGIGLNSSGGLVHYTDAIFFCED